MATVGMVIYHFLVDLEMIYGIQLGAYKFPLIILARVVAGWFALLVGVSGAIRFEKIKQLGVKNALLSFGKRATLILGWAGAISVVTYVLFPRNMVVFGILHFIGLSLVLMIPFLYLKNNYVLAMLGIIFGGAGLIVSSLETTNFGLLIFGVVPKTFESLDYFPLFPWFGLVLIGIVLGRVVAKKSVLSTDSFLSKLGRNSLLIYLIHQPILWGILLVLKLLIGGFGG